VTDTSKISLWRRAACWLGLAAACAFFTGPLLDPDLPWHLGAARHMLETGAVPRADFLSWTLAGKPWVDFEWGAQLLMYAVHKSAGTTGLLLLKAAAYSGVTLSFASLLMLWELPLAWAALAAPLFAMALLAVAQIRPEIFSLLLFSLELQLLERRRLGRLRMGDGTIAVLHAAIYALWANLHAGFVTGILLCLCYCAGELLSGNKKGFRLLGFAAAGMAATLINPYGIGIYVVLADHWRHMAYLQYLITEWDSPGFSTYHIDGYWLVLAVSLAGLLAAVARGIRLPPEHLAAVLLFGACASRAIRTLPYVVILIYPMALLAWWRMVSPRWWRIARVPLMAVFALFMLWRLVPMLIGFRIMTLPGPLLARGPQHACDFLRAEKKIFVPLRMYNPYNWGGYIGYSMYPDFKVFIDGRYLFVDLLTDVDTAQKDPDGWSDFLENRGVDYILDYNDGLMLRTKNDAVGHPFNAVALPKEKWALVYWDSVSMVLVRRDRVPKDWLARHEFRLLYPHDLRALRDRISGHKDEVDAAAAEIGRYASEIGDPLEIARLQNWYASLQSK